MSRSGYTKRTINNHEVSVGVVREHSRPLFAPFPATPLEALMQCRPHDEAVTSTLERMQLDEAVADAFDQLCDQDRYLLDAWHVEHVTIRDLAERLGLHKSRTHRLVRRAEARLRDRLAS